MSRRILYLTGTRADFGLMLPTLRRVDATPGLAVEVCITGMHLSERFGNTSQEVLSSGLNVVWRTDTSVDEDSTDGMARSAAQVALGFADCIREKRPDICMILGDRWEALAGAMSAAVAGVPIVHVCGGERSGSIDDSMRHAISKLAHVHAVATEGSRERLLRMGEEPERIHVVGSPGLVGIRELATRQREDLVHGFGLRADQPIALFLFHPVVQDAAVAGRQVKAILDALAARRFQAICLMPNADTGNGLVREALEAAAAGQRSVKLARHLHRTEYLSMLAGADILVGNSSSGIIEAASFGTPVVNVGDRQKSRERNANTFDCDATTESVEAAMAMAVRHPRNDCRNIYGDGQTDERISGLLAGLALDGSLLKKSMSY